MHSADMIDVVIHHRIGVELAFLLCQGFALSYRQGKGRVIAQIYDSIPGDDLQSFLRSMITAVVEEATAI